MRMVIRHNCDVINHVKMRILFRKHEKKKKMQCKISHSGWLGKVSIIHKACAVIVLCLHAQ